MPKRPGYEVVDLVWQLVGSWRHGGRLTSNNPVPVPIINIYGVYIYTDMRRGGALYIHDQGLMNAYINADVETEIS